MKRIKPSDNEHRWPRREVKSIETRKRDLVIRIADWFSDSDEPAFDVEVYVGGVYYWYLSKSFTKHEHKTKAKCRKLAVDFAGQQIENLL